MQKQNYVKSMLKTKVINTKKMYQLFTSFSYPYFLFISIICISGNGIMQWCVSSYH